MQRRRALILAIVLAVMLLQNGLSVQAGGSGLAMQFGDDRFGVALRGSLLQAYTLGTRWFINCGASKLSPPAGTIWVPCVRLDSSTIDARALRDRVETNHGAYWLMGNEPNVSGAAQALSGEVYARALHDAAAIIKTADPTARMVGPNILNFDFTCVACPGYESGHAWMDRFLSAYQAAYGDPPPLDIWSIHTYPLDFAHLPQTNAGLVEEQLRAFRSYLDLIPAFAGSPIWDTEFGTIWGYDGLEWRDEGNGVVRAYSVGDYRSDLLLEYMQEVCTWLVENGPALHVDRWFFYVSYADGHEPWESVYGGINLLDGPGADARLTSFGQLYRELAGLPSTEY
ncbi:MAG: glycosyl hydrolase [Dehalococcoidia bacterium]